MASWQQTIIIGNVGKDPEMRYLQNGTAVCSFSVAVTEKWTDKNSNEKREDTTWYKVSCWRQLAETANNYVVKGMQIMVVGKVKSRAYIDNGGEAQSSLELTAQSFQFLGQKGERNNQQDDDYSDSDEIPF